MSRGVAPTHNRDPDQGGGAGPGLGGGAALDAQAERVLGLLLADMPVKSAARLAGVRGGSIYRAEQKVVQKGAPTRPASAPPLERECQGLWAEHQRVIQNKR